VPEHAADGLDAGGVASSSGVPLARPAPVAVHDDRDVRGIAAGAPRRCGGVGRCRDAGDQARGPSGGASSGGRSAREPLDLEDLLFLRQPEAIDLGDVAVGGLLEASCERCASSVPTSPSALALEVVGCLAAEVADLDPGLLHALVDDPTRSLRRSSVSGGMLSRTTVPSTFGVRPMSLFVIAFSIAPRTLRSQGWMTIWCTPGR
jgi:hypothetical protein